MMDFDIELSNLPSTEAVSFGKPEKKTTKKKKLPALQYNLIELLGFMISLYVANSNLFMC